MDKCFVFDVVAWPFFFFFFMFVCVCVWSLYARKVDIISSHLENSLFCCMTPPSDASVWFCTAYQWSTNLLPGGCAFFRRILIIRPKDATFPVRRPLRTHKRMQREKKRVIDPSISKILNGYPQVLREKEVLSGKECERGRCTWVGTCAPALLHLQRPIITQQTTARRMLNGFYIECYVVPGGEAIRFIPPTIWRKLFNPVSIFFFRKALVTKITMPSSKFSSGSSVTCDKVIHDTVDYEPYCVMQ